MCEGRHYTCILYVAASCHCRKNSLCCPVSMLHCDIPFQGLCIYSTKSVIPEFATLKTIVQAAGGEVSTEEHCTRTWTVCTLLGKCLLQFRLSFLPLLQLLSLEEVKLTYGPVLDRQVCMHEQSLYCTSRMHYLCPQYAMYVCMYVCMYTCTVHVTSNLQVSAGLPCRESANGRAAGC